MAPRVGISSRGFFLFQTRFSHISLREYGAPKS
jgi:hypothetical protein